MSVIPQVLWFAKQMEESLEANAIKGGWKDAPSRWLLQRLKEEALELAEALALGQSDLIIKESSDVANFAMMIADKARKEAQRG